MPTRNLNPLMTITQNNPLTKTPADLNPDSGGSFGSNTFSSDLSNNFSSQPVDIHPALDKVRALPEFAPEKPPFWEDWFKNSSIQPWIDKAEEWFEAMKAAFREYMNSHVQDASQAVPQNVIDTLSYTIGVLVVLGILFLLYMFLNSLKRFVFERGDEDTQLQNNITTVKASGYHLKHSQHLLAQKKINEAMHQLYLAWLATLDEEQVVPYDESKTNREYQHSLHDSEQKTIAGQFKQVADYFEQSFFGKETLAEKDVEESLSQFHQAINTIKSTDKSKGGGR